MLLSFIRTIARRTTISPINSARLVYPCQNLFLHYTQRCLATKVGDKASLSKVFTEDDIKKFADVCLDHNPIHQDREYAAKTRFGKPIVHGVLNVGLLSAVFGTVLPGEGSILMNYNIGYPAPLYVGEKVTAQVEALEVKRRTATFKMTCFTDDGKVVADGSAVIFLPKEKKDSR